MPPSLPPPPRPDPPKTRPPPATQTRSRRPPQDPSRAGRLCTPDAPATQTRSRRPPQDPPRRPPVRPTRRPSGPQPLPPLATQALTSATCNPPASPGLPARPGTRAPRVAFGRSGWIPRTTLCTKRPLVTGHSASIMVISCARYTPVSDVTGGSRSCRIRPPGTAHPGALCNRYDHLCPVTQPGDWSCRLQSPRRWLMWLVRSRVGRVWPPVWMPRLTL
jgi:hypothetical protein